MSVTGIICEYDPLHTGHAWLMAQVRAAGASAVVCAMSGNFTQRGGFAAADKLARAEMAVACGADLVLEMPTVWAMSTAERFARGGVEVLTRTGVVTELLFGSESGDMAALARCADCLDSGDLTAALAAVPEDGRTFAARRQQAVEAIAAGIGLVRAQKAAGVQLLATGEMGIGNTTTSSAVAAVLLGQPVERMTGRGAGLSDAGLARKLDAIRRGIARNQPDAADPLDVLSKLGGFDIAGLCGVFLGGALEGLPVLMDGFISGVAALCAVRLCPAAEKAVFASHCSTEPAARLVLEALGKAPLLTAGLHLGEGTGAVASIPLWDMALAVYRDCYSFTEGGITPYTPQC